MHEKTGLPALLPAPPRRNFLVTLDKAASILAHFLLGVVLFSNQKEVARASAVAALDHSTLMFADLITFAHLSAWDFM
jgi:hypothetical protein